MAKLQGGPMSQLRNLVMVCNHISEVFELLVVQFMCNSIHFKC